MFGINLPDPSSMLGGVSAQIADAQKAQAVQKPQLGAPSTGYAQLNNHAAAYATANDTGLPNQPKAPAAQPAGGYATPAAAPPAAQPAPPPPQPAAQNQPVPAQAPVASAPYPMQAPRQAQLGAPPQSIMQQASRGGAQSVQNFMTALNRTGAGGNNAFMNAPGQLGAGPQAGFRGFSQNGSYGPQMVNQYNTGAMNANYGQQANQAAIQGNYSQANSARQGAYAQAAGPEAYTSGWGGTGTGGVAGQPQWETPKPWTQPGNSAPGQPGSYIADDSKGWDQYFNTPQGSYGPAPTTPGAFYSGAPPGTQNPQPGSIAPPPDPSGYVDGPPLDVSEYEASVSDERAKENISDAKGELQDFLDNLGVYSYEYKNKEHGAGRYISPMAQEFEKSKLGAQAVETDPQTGLKRVQYGRLIGIQSAALALVNQKYNALEQKFNAEISKKIKAKRK